MKFIYLKIIILLLSSNTIIKAIDGQGTKDNPFLITNIYEMQEIIEGDTLLYYRLINDIDASDTRNWNVGDHDRNPNTPDEPMGFKPLYFSGQIDGNGHIIFNLFINRPSEDYVGLIGQLKGDYFTIKKGIIYQLGIEKCYIKGRNYVGSICGYFSLIGLIQESYSNGIIFANNNSGGFCGWNGSLDGIINCFTSCTISTDNSSDFSIATFCNGFNSFWYANKCYTSGTAISQKKESNFGILEYASNCFWDIETTGIIDTGGHQAKGLPSSEMKKKATYINAGWDFDNVWCIDEGKDYPKLRAFGKCPPTDVPEKPIEIENKLDAFPNPASSSIDVMFKIQHVGTAQIIITNSYGQQVYNANVNYMNASYEQKHTIDISSFSSGLYFVSLRSPAVAMTKGVVVVK
ncbi:MAG: T9SS type A sorting domain-containing protein [Bacteroidetes bacterium]|nr:MAG: T9SS type A sorting domain-containing protein [Bacteroidota bacterium]